MSKLEYKVIYQGKEYESIREFDCRVVSLGNEKEGCSGFFTVIPISPKDYRENEHKTKAKVKIETEKNFTVFNIWSDWGDTYVMRIHNSLEKEIATAIEAAERQGLLT